MHPILSRFGPFFLYSYTVVMALAILLGLLLTALLERRAEERIPGWIDGFLALLVAGIIGGRLVFVAVNWSYYQDNAGEIALITRGGLNYHGALFAGLLALFLWTAWQRRPFEPYAGLLAPAFAIGSVLGWLACWLAGCAYGRETVFGPLAADLPDSFGVSDLRFQTQLMGLLISLLVALLILALYRRLRPLLLFWLTLLLLSSGRVVITFFRGDEAPTIGQYRLDTLAGGIVILISLLAIIILVFRKRQVKVENEINTWE